MYSDRVFKYTEALYVIKNLCNDTRKELELIYGNDYQKRVLEEIYKAQEKYIIKLKNTDEAVGLFGLTFEGEGVGGIFLLTTDNLHNGNLITFLRCTKLQIKEWEKNYKLIMDNCYKRNATIKKWLKLLGFKPSKHQNEDFQIYYTGDINLYGGE